MLPYFRKLLESLLKNRFQLIDMKLAPQQNRRAVYRQSSTFALCYPATLQLFDQSENDQAIAAN